MSHEKEPSTAALDAARRRLIFALDYPDLHAAREAARSLRGQLGLVKVGLELFVAHGPEAVSLGREANAEVFLDLKLHDIPATVSRAVQAAVNIGGVRFLTVHAGGGEAMLRAAVEAAGDALTIVAVTVLTSLDQSDLADLGVTAKVGDHTTRLGEIARTAGVEAFVCSPLEAAALRQKLRAPVTLITPGVRPAGGDRGDQKRTMTPAEAIAAGADFLVVGRPIRDAADPVDAAAAIVRSIAG